MTYTKQTWANGSAGGTPVDAPALQRMEDGIEAANILADGITVARSPQVVGGYYPAMLTNQTRTLALVVGEAYLAPCFTPVPITIDTLSVSVTTLAASALHRMGLARPASQSNPFAFAAAATVLGDAGTVDCSTTGLKTATFGTPVVVPAGWFFLLGVSQTAAATLAVAGNAGATGFSPLGLASSGAGGISTQPNVALKVSGITGAFGSTITPAGFGTTDAGVIYRRSA